MPLAVKCTEGSNLLKYILLPPPVQMCQWDGDKREFIMFIIVLGISCTKKKYFPFQKVQIR